MNFGFTVFGLAFGFGIFAWAWRVKATFWRKLAGVYGTRKWPMSPNGKKYMAHIMLFGSRWSWINYAGITTVAVTDQAVWLKLLPPFSWMHKPLMLPFADLKVEQGEWYLNDSTFEIVASHANGIRIVIPGELMDWLALNAPHRNLATRRGW